MATYAKKFPNVELRDHGLHIHEPPFATKPGKLLRRPRTSRASRTPRTGGLPRRRARGQDGQEDGREHVGAVGGIKIPPVDIWIAGYKYCANKAVPGTKVLVQYSNDFVATDKCQTVAQNEIGQGAKVMFQVAGGCGLGALKAADAAKLWGIGVDVDEYNDAKRDPHERDEEDRHRRLRRDPAAANGKFKGGTNLVFDLKNGGVGVGKINPSVPKAWITLMNAYKAKIIAGTLKVPASL